MIIEKKKKVKIQSLVCFIEQHTRDSKVRARFSIEINVIVMRSENKKGKSKGIV